MIQDRDKKNKPIDKMRKMPHFGYDLANKDYKQIIQNAWDKLNEIIEWINIKKENE